VPIGRKPTERNSVRSPDFGAGLLTGWRDGMLTIQPVIEETCESIKNIFATAPRNFAG
jgi:hypothetical protein